MDALVATVAISLPGLLLAAAVLPWWHRLRQVRPAQAMLRGVNAGVVGLLAAAFYDPVWTSSVRGAADLSIAAAAFVLLAAWRTRPVVVVGLCGLAGLVFTAP